MNLDIVSFFYLPIIFYIGILTSVDDWKTQKIKNKILLRGFLAGLAVFVFLLLWSLLMKPDSSFYSIVENVFPEQVFLFQTVYFSFFLKTILNFLVSFFFGFLMWKYRIMAAGDAKLFALFSWLIPTTYYWKTYMFLWPSFALLVNIFVVIFLYIIFISFFFWVKNIISFINKKKTSAFVVNKKNLFSVQFNKKIKKKPWVFFIIICIFLIIKNVNIYTSLSFGENFGIYQGYLMAFFIIFSSQIVEAIKQEKVRETFFVILIINVILSFINSPADLFNYLVRVIIIMSVFLIIYDLLLRLMNFYFNNSAVNKISIDDLKTGDIISDRAIQQLKKDKIIFHKYVGRIFPRGLVENEIITIKDWAKKKGEAYIPVYKHFPFAFWIFMGVLVTLIFEGSVLNIFLNNLWM